MPASYWLKAYRADQHLNEIKTLLAPYEVPRPYTVRHSVEGKDHRHVYRAFVDEQPDPWVAVVFGGLLFYLRSALDHLRVALVPRKERYGPPFPIFTEDIWERDPATGDYVERTERSRQIWEHAVRGMSPDAIAKIDDMQPFRFPNEDSPHMALALLNRLNNADKHRELVTVVHHLKDIEITIDGLISDIPLNLPDDAILGNGAVIVRSQTEVNVEARGAITVGIGASPLAAEGYVLPQVGKTIVAYVLAVLTTLEPFVKT